MENLAENLAENLVESLAENLAESLVENLAEMVEGTNLFKKGIDWWKYSICNGVMGSWPISIQCGKSCAENLAENLVESLAENLCLVENLAEMGMVETNLFKKGIDWWKYSICNGVMGSWPISIQCGKSCGKS